MRILLCCGEQGLLTYNDGWQRLPCPLASPRLLAVAGGRMAVADPDQGMLWAMERLTPIDRGAEAQLLSPEHALVLSGETDCLSLIELRTGQMLVTAPAGMYPQEMCLVNRRLVAVCGGADGSVRLMDPWTLYTRQTFSLPGHTQRITCSGGAMYVLCAVYEGMLHCLLYRIRSDGQIKRLLTLPGLPGALCPDGRGGVWAAASETLAHVPMGSHQLGRQIADTGLIRHMTAAGGMLLTSDPVLGVCRLYGDEGQVIAERQGDVGQVVLLP